MTQPLMSSELSGSLCVRQINGHSDVVSVAGDDARPALLFLHGWGSSSAIWSPIFASLQERFSLFCLDLPGHAENVDCEPESVEQFLYLFERDVVEKLPPRFIVVGWSLGGLLASFLARQYSDNVVALFTIATSPRFVASTVWQYGMSGDVFEDFYARFAVNSEAVLQEFMLLQCSGAENKGALRRYLTEKKSANTYSWKALRYGLDWLKHIDLRDLWHGLPMPVFHSYGQHDHIVPADVMAAVERAFKNHTVHSYKQSSHLPFITEAELWLADFEADVSGVLASVAGKDRLPEPSGIDDVAVARAFNLSAPQYDSLALVQQKIAQDLVRELPLEAGGDVLDLGSGTGFVSREMSRHCDCRCVQLDIAEGMLHQARRVCSGERSINDPGAYVQATMQQLPFAPDSFDSIVSSLSIQWCPDIVQLMEEAYRVLKPDGVFAFSTLLPGTLEEISSAWSAIDGAPHVHEFVETPLLRSFAQKSGLQVHSLREQVYRETFTNARALLASVNGIGAGNHRTDRHIGLMGKQRYMQLLDELSRRRNKLTYHVAFVHLAKPPSFGE